MISKRGLKELAGQKRVDHDTFNALDGWFRIAQKAEWRNVADVQADFPSVDQVGSVLIFNIRHNRYRLIVFVVYPKQKLYLKALLTHKEYDRKEWMKWA